MKIILIFIVAALFVGTGVGQIAKGVVEREQRAKMERENDERLSDLEKRQAELQNPAPRFIDRFVGRTGNSWAVSLVSQGGFFGFRTVASINSDKKAYCGIDQDSMILVDVPEDLILQLKTLVDAPQDLELAHADHIAGCKDCSVESLVVSIRSGADIRSRTIKVSKAPEFSRIYDAMYNFRGCREKGN